MFVTLFWAILFLLDKKRNLPQSYLIFFLLVAFVNYLSHASFFMHEYKLFAFLDNIWVFTSLAVFPIYYYYIRLLTNDTHIKWKWGWILIPSITLSLFSFAVYLSMTNEELNLYIHDIMYHEKSSIASYSLDIRLLIIKNLAFKIIFTIQVVLVVIYGIRLITAYNRRLVHFYSNIQERNLTPFKTLLMAFVCTSIISILSNFIGKDYFIDKDILLTIPSILHSAFLYWVAYAGFNQRFIISDFNRDIENYRKQKEKINKENIQEQNGIHNIAKTLTSIITEEKLFTKNDLKISDLAIRINTNRAYISRALNEEMNTDFCTWVNNYRIDFARQLMRDPKYPNLSMESIAEMSGFSNITTFYRVFKKHTKMTPGNFMKSIQQDASEKTNSNID